jgi:PPK2 family polyphosphate:nucleotide phosphotransferase
MDKHIIKPGQHIRLDDLSPDDHGDWKGKKEEGLAKLVELRQELDRQQGLLYAEHKHKLLIVLQAMDTAGKDGVIRSVLEGVNPQGVRVAAFKVPTPLEADHDFLWRVHAQTPAKGEMVVFNRSHYEQVLVVRVHQLEPEETWRKHYAEINEFERMLADDGATILKFFLHIDKDEQKKRLLARLEDPAKNWKFSASDLPERKLWSDYMKAYEEALNLTSTAYAPWYVVPSNSNWYRNLVVASVIVDAMQKLDMHYPAPTQDLAQFRKALEAE